MRVRCSYVRRSVDWGTIVDYRVAFVAVTACLVFGCESAVDKRAARLKQQLAQAQNELTAAKRALQQSQTTVEMLTGQLVRVKVERDKLKQELAALRGKAP